MSQYSDRLDEIRTGRDKTYAHNAQKGIPNDSLPQMHKDLYWLLEVVEANDDMIRERQHFETAAKIKMKR